MEKILEFLNLLDRNNKLSISNIAVYAILIKLLLSPELGSFDAAAFLTVIANYSAKRYTNYKSTEKISSEASKTIDKKLSELDEKINSLSVRIEMK